MLSKKNIKKLFGDKGIKIIDGVRLDRDAIAELLRTTPEALEAFEESYMKYTDKEIPEDFFKVNSRQAAAEKRAVPENGTEADCNAQTAADGLASRIVDELLYFPTWRYVYDGKSGRYEAFVPARENGTTHTEKQVTSDEIKALPESLRPQLSGSLMKKDFSADSAPAILFNYKMFREEKDPKKKMLHYGLFRQGLDILDLDPITYEVIGMNRNSMGHWLPQLVKANAAVDVPFFKIPETAVVKVPLPILQLTRVGYESLTGTTLKIVDQWAQKAFSLDPEPADGYFIKTGTYSSKFDFRNAKVASPQEIREIGEYLLYIHTQACQMASPLCQPHPIYGVSTTNEWAVRRFIPDKEGNPCIYKGLPLHTEYRVFIDCDEKQILGYGPYWEPETMKKRFGHSNGPSSPHQVHDYIIYKAHEAKLMERYDQNAQKVASHVMELLPHLRLEGQWSLDIMQNGDDFWLIDMALAQNSAFRELIPERLRHPSDEKWLPRIPDAADVRDAGKTKKIQEENKACLKNI